jgi:hypothetical protein
MAAISTKFIYTLDLTRQACIDKRLPILYPGDTVTYRFKVRSREGVAVDLTGYVLVWVMRRKLSDAASAAALMRRSLDDIADFSPAGTKQIAIDIAGAGQASETVDAYGNATGRGCFEMRFKPEDEALLVAAQGTGYHGMVLKPPTAEQFTFFEGRVEIPWRAPRVAQMT